MSASTALRRPARLLAPLALSCLAPAWGQTLVDNVNGTPLAPGSRFSLPAEFTALGSSTLFSADDFVFGRELWITDTTGAGTQRLFDCNPGSGDGDPQSFGHLDAGTLLFTARSFDTGRELWRTDGTAAGTSRVTDLFPGSGDAFFDAAEAFEVDGGQAYFVAYTGPASRSLFRSDGTAAGTEELFSIPNPGGNVVGSYGDIQIEITPAGVYFADVSYPNTRLWLWAGTPGQASPLYDAPSGLFGGAQGLTALGDGVVFGVFDALTWSEPWYSDGTAAGTVQLADISPGQQSSSPNGFVEFEGELYFRAQPGAGASQLWKTDGTPAGTSLAIPFEFGQPVLSSVGELVPLGGFLLFQADESSVGRELFAIGGGAPSCFLVADFNPGPADGNPMGMVELNGEVLCTAQDSSSGLELWATDGTPSGTRLVADIAAGEQAGAPTDLTPAPGGILFAATGPGTGREPWFSDGTGAGTRLVEDIAVDPTDGGSFPTSHVSLGSQSLFLVGTPPAQWWTSDGIGAGTGILGDPNPGPATAAVGNSPLENDGLAYVTASTSEFGVELYVTAGGPGDLTRISNFDNNFAAKVRMLGARGGEVYFAARTSGTGNELWSTRGTLLSTKLVADINPGSNDSNPDQLVVVGDQILFTANSPGFGKELWTTTSPLFGGAQLVADIEPGPETSLLDAELVAFDGRAYFSAFTTAQGGFELWRSDGTTAGTELFRDFEPGVGAPEAFRVLGDRLLFMASDDLVGRQLWALEAGTETLARLTDVATPGSDGIRNDPFLAGDVAYLLYDDAGGYQRLLRTDGTVAGTSTVATIDPTGTQGLPDDADAWGATGGAAIFTANDGLFGAELWITDGTSAGTQRLTDVFPGAPGSDPRDLARVGNRLLFTADDGLTGPELHQVPLGQPGTWIAEPFGLGCGTAAGPPQIGHSGAASLGSPFAVVLSEAQPAAPAFLYLGFDYARTVVGGGCKVHVANPTLVLSAATDGSGTLAVPFVVPDEPALIGLELWFQFLSAEAGGPLGSAASLSPALEVVISS